MRDARGRELQVGDQVVYGSRYGSTLELRVLVVEAVRPFSIDARPYDAAGFPKTTRYGKPSLLVKLAPLTREPAGCS